MTTRQRNATAPKLAARELELGARVADGLNSFADTASARRLAVLEADTELVLQLALQGFAGSAWDRFAHALAEYGVQVIRAWVFSGAIFRRCSEKGFGKLPTMTRSQDDSAELANECVAEAIRAFRAKVLMAKRWDPRRGASLKTFFIGQCIFQFPNVYRRWVRENCEPAPLEAIASDPPQTTMSARARLEAIEALSALSGDVRLLEVLDDAGYSQAEIADLTGTTLRGVQSKLYRLRKASR